MTKTIIYVINSIKKNGPSVVLENMVKGLQGEGYTIHVVTLLKENDKVILARFKKYGITHTGFGYRSKRELMKKKTIDLQRIVDDIQPDVIHSHGLFPDYVIAQLTTSARKVTTVHNSPFEDYRNRFGLIPGTLVAWWQVGMFNKFDSIVCCSETSYKKLRWYVRRPITFVRNSINDNEKWNAKKERIRLQLRNDLNIEKNDMVYIFVGGLVPGKNVRFLVDNFKAHHAPNEKLIMLGDGPDMAYCQENKDDSVRLLGFQKDVEKYYMASDVYISASKSEGFSISVLEALENGLHLFLSNIPSHKEVFTVDKRSFIGRTFAPQSFDAEIKKLRKKMKSSSRSDVIAFKNKYFTAKVMMDKYKKVYEG